MTSIDRLDADLIELLTIHPRIGIVELARRLGVARGTVQSRMAKLAERGAVTGFGPQVDPVEIGYPVLAFIFLEIAQGRLAEAVQTLEAVPEVLEAHGTTGARDLLCRVVARDNEPPAGDHQRRAVLLGRAALHLLHRHVAADRPAVAAARARGGPAVTRRVLRTAPPLSDAFDAIRAELGIEEAFRSGGARRGRGGRARRPRAASGRARSCRSSRSTRRDRATSTRRCTSARRGGGFRVSLRDRRPGRVRRAGRGAGRGRVGARSDDVRAGPARSAAPARAVGGGGEPAARRGPPGDPVDDRPRRGRGATAVDVRRAVVRSTARLDYAGVQARLDAGRRRSRCCCCRGRPAARGAGARPRRRLAPPAPAGGGACEGGGWTVATGRRCRSRASTPRSRCSPAWRPRT